jgi:hypothetical protein
MFRTNIIQVTITLFMTNRGFAIATEIVDHFNQVTIQFIELM